jgi:hypothetical protein
MISTFVNFAQNHIAPTREQLVKQLLAGTTGDEKSEFVRGQIRGIDRALVALSEASRKFASEVGND